MSPNAQIVSDGEDGKSRLTCAKACGLILQHNRRIA